MSQEQWDRKCYQRIGILAFRKSWWFGRSNSEISLNDLIFGALDPLHFLKVRSREGVLGRSPEITNLLPVMLVWGHSPWQADLWAERYGQTLACHTDTAYFNFPQEKGKTTLLVLLNPFSCWRSPCIRMPAHFSSPQNAWGPWPGFQFPSQDRAVLLLSLKTANLGSLIWCCSQVLSSHSIVFKGRELPTQLCNLNSPFRPLSPLSENPSGTWHTSGFQTCRRSSSLALSLLMQYLPLSGRDSSSWQLFCLVFYFG